LRQPDAHQIDEFAIQRNGASMLRFGFTHGIDDSLRLRDLRLGRGKQFVRYIELGRMNDLFPFIAEDRRVPARSE
jgi:hypothetical protein